MADVSLLDDLNRRRWQQPQSRGVSGFFPNLPVPIQPAPAPAPVRNPNPSFIDQFMAESHAPEPQEQQDDGGGGFGRGLGFVVNNPITQAALKPLQALDVPRRGIWSTVQEGTDWLQGEGFSGGDWLEQVKDPTFGAGDVIPDTGNKWLDRGIGLAGDIALDPLTYVAGLGFASKTGSAGGKLNRARAVGKAVDKGADAAEAASVLRRGFGAASDDFLEAAGVQGGIRIGAPFTRGKTIPGSERLTRPVSKARGRVAEAFNQTGAGGALQRTRAPLGLEDAFETMFRGKGNMTVPQALERVAIDEGRNLAGGAFMGVAQRETQRVRRELSKMGDAEKASLLRQTEAGKSTVLSRAFSKLLKQAQDQGVPLKKRQAYTTHITTRDGRKWINDGGEAAKDFQRATKLTTVDLYDPSGVTMGRKITKGQTIKLNGKTVEIKDDSIDGLNKMFRKEYGLDFDMYESDPGLILEKYINMLSGDIGWAKRR